MPDCLLYNKDTMLNGLVLKVTEAGVLLWKAKATQVAPNIVLYTLSTENVAERVNFEHAVITEYQPWLCCSVQGVAPKRLQQLLGDAARSTQFAIVGLKTGKKTPLLRFGMQRGLSQMTAVQMKKLWKLLGKSKRAPPNSVKELLQGLATQILGPSGDWTLESLLAEREKKQYIEVPTPLNSKEMLEQCADAFCPGDFQELYAAAPAAETGTDHPGSSSAASSAQPPPPPPRSKTPWPLPARQSVYTEDDISPLLPQDVEFRLYREMNQYHTRWRVSFPTLPQPNFFSRNFGGIFTEEDAVKRLVKAAWALYERERGQPCPWRF